MGTDNQADTSHNLLRVGIISSQLNQNANNCFAVSRIHHISKGVTLAKADKSFSKELANSQLLSIEPNATCACSNLEANQVIELAQFVKICVSHNPATKVQTCQKVCDNHHHIQLNFDCNLDKSLSPVFT
jgi:hypothetical protein